MLLGIQDRVLNPIFLVAIALFIAFLSYLATSSILHPLFRTNSLLDNLLKNTLHELNVPLSTIKANTQLLMLSANDNDKKRLGRIKKASEHLYRLYEEVDYHIKKELSPIKREIFDAKGVATECIEQIKSLNTNISLSQDLEKTIIKADNIGFYKIIFNLLSNAYKYNKPNGSVHVSLKNNELTIKDTGIGMSEETRFRIFDRYYQNRQNSQGYGIGLNIVKEYCDEHKIFISLISKEDEGTCVKLDLESVKFSQNE